MLVGHDFFHPCLSIFTQAISGLKLDTVVTASG
jgi:hypothetical protein